MKICSTWKKEKKTLFYKTVLNLEIRLDPVVNCSTHPDQIVFFDAGHLVYNGCLQRVYGTVRFHVTFHTR